MIVSRAAGWGRPVRPLPPRAPRASALALALLTVAALAGSAPAGSQAPPATYGARPAVYGTADEPQVGFAHGIEDGWHVADAVEIFNYTGQPIPFLIYGADMVATATGDPVPAAGDAERTGAGAWIEVGNGRVEVPPHSSVVAPFEIRVPYGTPPGPHTAAVLVELDRGTASGMVVNRTRIGLPVTVDVVGAIDLGVEVGAVRWQGGDDGLRFTVPVTNTGTTSFVLTGYVRVGEPDGPVEADPVLTPGGFFLAPGRSAEVEATWSDPPWLGRVTAAAVVQATVAGHPPATVTGDEVSFWIVPWRTLGFALALAVGLFVLLRTTRDLRHAWLWRRREERALVRVHRAERAEREARERTDHPVA